MWRHFMFSCKSPEMFSLWNFSCKENSHSCTIKKLAVRKLPLSWTSALNLCSLLFNLLNVKKISQSPRWRFQIAKQKHLTFTSEELEPANIQHSWLHLTILICWLFSWIIDEMFGAVICWKTVMMVTSSNVKCYSVYCHRGGKKPGNIHI